MKSKNIRSEDLEKFLPRLFADESRELQHVTTVIDQQVKAGNFAFAADYAKQVGLEDRAKELYAKASEKAKQKGDFRYATYFAKQAGLDDTANEIGAGEE